MRATDRIGIVLAASVLALGGPSLADEATEALEARLTHADSAGVERERRLVAARVRGRERGLIEILRDEDGLLIPLFELGRMLEIEFRREGEALRAETPLGEVFVPTTLVEEIDETTYVRQSYVSEQLHSRLRFDPADYSIVIEPLWNAPERSRGSNEQTIDVGPPDTTIAGLRAIVDHTRSQDESLNSGSLQMVGRLGEGVWSLTAEDSDRRPFNLREYTWYRRDGESHYLAGRQRLQLHSALGSFDLAGFQYGWSNGPNANQPVTYGANALFPRRGQPLETVRGESQPGHFVQLRVDGRVVGARQVGFNGKFVFDDVPLPTRRAAEIELLVYDPTNLRVPIEIRRVRRSASEFFMPEQTSSHMVGLGWAGRLSEGLAGAQEGAPEGIGGYYQWRQGLNRRITGEALVQHDGEDAEGYVGFVSRLAETWVASVGAIQTSDATGYQADIEGFLPRWSFLARSLVRPGDIGFSRVETSTRDHMIEVGHDFPDQRLEIGLIARKRQDLLNDIEFVRPRITWQPAANLYFDARPNFDGEYLLGASYRPDRSTYLRYFRSDASNFEATRELGDDWRVGLGAEWEIFDPRYTAWLSRNYHAFGGIYVGRAGVVRTQDRWGYAVAGSGPVAPGVVARAEYQSIPRADLFGDDQSRFSLSLVTDLAFSGGAVQPARALPYRRESGLIIGRITIDNESQRLSGVSATDFDLSGAQLLVDGAARTTTDASGRFTIANLPAGVYEIEIDPEKLPIELSPTRLRLRAEIAAGASTRVDFAVRLEYGAAGRVVDPEGRALPGVRVELRSIYGDVLEQTRSDTFGLYRLDGVAPGSYHLVATRDGQVVARRALTIASDFLFGQDLAIVGPAEPRPFADGAAASE